MNMQEIPKRIGGIFQNTTSRKESESELQIKPGFYITPCKARLSSAKQLISGPSTRGIYKNVASDQNLFTESTPRSLIQSISRSRMRRSSRPKVPGPFGSNIRPAEPKHTGDMDSVDEHEAQKPRHTSFSYASQLAFSKPAINTLRNLNNVSIALSRSSFIHEEGPLINSQVSPIHRQTCEPPQNFDKLIITRLSSISLHLGDEEDRENAQHLNTEQNLQLGGNTNTDHNLHVNNPSMQQNLVSLNAINGVLPNLRIEFTPMYGSDGDFNKSGIRSMNRSFNRSDTASRKQKEKSRISAYKSSIFNDLSRHETIEIVDSNDNHKPLMMMNPNKFTKSRSLRSNESGSRINESFDIGELFRQYSSGNHANSSQHELPPGTFLTIREALAAGMKWYQPHPEGLFKSVWETVKFVLLIYLLIILPLRVAFIDDVPFMWYILDKLIDFFFLCDLALNFVTPIPINYEFVFDTKIISKEYLIGWFALDLMGIIPFEEILLLYSEVTSGVQLLARLGKALRLLRLFKLFRLLRTFDFTNSDNYILKFLDANYRGTVFYLLLPNTLLMLFLLHLFACIFYLEATWNIDSKNDTWVIINHFSDKDPLYLYISSFYLVVATYTSTGYGDVNTVTDTEMMLKIIVMIMGALLYGIFTGRIVENISSKMEKSQVLESKLKALEKINRNYEIPVHTELAIIENLEFKILYDKEIYRRRLDFSRLSNIDKDLLDFLTFVNQFKNIPLFDKCKHFNHIDWILKMGRRAKQVIFREDDVIYSKGDNASYFYMIYEGRVGVMMSQVPIVPIISIEKGFFGEIELITGTPRMHTIMALTEKVILYRLELGDFKQLFLEDDEDSSLSIDIHKFVEKRIKSFQEAQDQFDEIIRRKFFWKLVLRGRKKKPKDKKLLGFGKLNTLDSTKPSNATSKTSCQSKESSDKP
jgi:Cyclic nucleotide-binding domain/Ion channel